MKHPLFSKCNMNSMMIMLKKCSAFVFLKKYQILYKEGDDAALLYVPIYGELTVWSQRHGQFGRLGLGATVGEEAVCDKQFSSRSDNCYAEAETGLICIVREKWLALKLQKDAQLQRDLTSLEDVFRRNHFTKKRWRTGIINSTRS
jgi:hypothetical protein